MGRRHPGPGPVAGHRRRPLQTRRNGSWWQTETVAAFENRGLSRDLALTEMLKLYAVGMHSNEPVHTWEVPG